jgi:hypothetical protein
MAVRHPGGGVNRTLPEQVFFDRVGQQNPNGGSSSEGHSVEWQM